MTIHSESIPDLLDILEQLNPDERAVVLDVATRSARKMLHGRRKYGEWQAATDTRDWNEEASQEADDIANYLAMARRQSQVRPSTSGGT